MANILLADMIDWQAYEHETEGKERVKPASLWVQELIDEIETPQPAKHAYLPWHKTRAQIQFRPGEVTIWGGANGNGKSLVTGQVALGLCAQGEKCCIASFEMKPKRTLQRMCRQFSHFNPHDPMFAGSPEARAELIRIYQSFKDWNDSRLWLYDQQGTVEASKVSAVARYCAKELGITHMFIDSLMKCVSGEDDFNGQKSFVDELTAIARDYDMHIHLVHHIRKPSGDQGESKKPSKYDYKGSGSITDQVDNVISVWRNKPKEKKADVGQPVDQNEPDTFLICDKQRNGEWEGQIGLWFERQSQQFIESFGASPILFDRGLEGGDYGF